MVHGPELGKGPPSPERESRRSVAVRHPETGHCVEDLACQLYLNSLSVEGPTSHTSTDDRFVSVNGVLDHAALAVTRRRVPLASSEFSDQANVAISFLQFGRGLWAEPGITPRWNEYPHCSAFTLVIGGFVNRLGVVGAVCGDRCDGVSSLL